MPYIPHTDEDIKAMLDTLGVKSIDALFDEIPEALRSDGLKDIPEGLSEMAINRLVGDRLSQDKQRLCFIGAGAYEHHIPAAVWDIAGRGEFMTAYTPYQAEASQGTLQLIYEYQTMMANLMAMEVSNASLYDGASGLAEAVLMAVRGNRKSKSKKVLVPKTVSPVYRTVTHNITKSQNIELVDVPYCTKTGVTPLDSLKAFEGEDITAVVIAQPNFFGGLEDVHALTDWAHAQGALVIAVVNPVAMALLTPPGEWGEAGADIACGEGQPLGVPLASGGPYFGFMTTQRALMRQLPGRVVGRTVDAEGKQGFALTLQAREQHIRRSKATSNICTNQGLLVTAATIHMSLLGPEGLLGVAKSCHERTNTLVKALTAVPGVEQVFEGATFHEALLTLNKPVDAVLKALGERGIQGGIAAERLYPGLKNTILVCATETKTQEDIQLYAEQLQSVLATLPENATVEEVQ